MSNMLQEPESIRAVFPLLYIFLAHSSVCFIHTHVFFFFSSKKAQGTAGPGDGNLSDAGVRHTLLIPRGDIICAICGRLQGSCRGVSLGTLAGRGPCLGTAPPPPARSGPAGPPFSPSTIFETAGIQSKHATALLSPF